jgi:toxin ParE1/3/4
MPRLLVREQADKDVDQIVEAIADDNLSAAMQFQDRVRETYDRIATWPQIGARIRARDEALRDMRYYPIRGYRNYLVFYLPLEDGAEIVHVIHGARDIPSALRSG